MRLVTGEVVEEVGGGEEAGNVFEGCGCAGARLMCRIETCWCTSKLEHAGARWSKDGGLRGGR
eukprot:3332552-Rhodomonas_salina.1